MTTKRIEHTPTIGSMVWRLALRWRSQVDRAVAPHGLTHATYSTLATLAGLAAGDATPTQRELADATGLEPPYISRLVRSLEAAGLVVRDEHPGDSRAVQLRVTPEGRRTIQAAMSTVRRLHDDLLAPLGGPGSDRSVELRGLLDDLLHPEAAPSSTTKNTGVVS